MAILFCNVGWMQKYDGLDADSLERGGSYNNHSIGHEVCNFTPVGDVVYGYIQANGNIKLENLGASKKDDSVDGVTVVWTASPPDGGTVVVGWYLNATVYRAVQQTPQKAAKHIAQGATYFRIKAKRKDAVLLEERSVLIPRATKGGIGQSNIWYADKPESKPIVERVMKLITEGPTPLPDIDETGGREGKVRLSAHLRRERNAKLVKKKKESVLKATGRLSCQVCGFDFKQVYGSYGENFCEVHHLTPLAKADCEVETKLDDLAVVCSNCHRIIHRHDPMPKIEQLAAAISGAKAC
ncbi:HNH endonuclease [Pseudogulbenkiania sp. NH8B]|uniref:HNH endonuclease n=1 Tax=Pseudogulbenkiania sp. (strain NH8B) TaxID=748280 RepID=UPI0002279F62|nr:HNH endonuclease [Pseudogulbenkiania sp. NH8B]BAK76713.1 HNH endonuclease [Pseudogulbenkiania sp. NH8B]